MSFIQKATVYLLLANVATVIIAGAMLFWPAQLPIIYNEPFPVHPTEVRKGETLTYVIEVHKRKAYTVEAHRNMVCSDGNLVTLTPSRTNIPVGRHVLTPNITIPEKASYATCFIDITYTYDVSPLRTVTQHMQTQPFTIVP